MSRLPVIAVAAAIILFLLYSSIFVVNERQQAIVLRFGEIVDVKTEPGIYFKMPFAFVEADNVQIIEDRILRFDLDNIRVQVSGGKFYEVDAFVAYRISNPRLFRQTVSGSLQLAEQRLRTRLDAALRRVYGLRGFEAALSEERGSMMREVRDQLRPDANSLGIEIADVRIRRTDLTDEVSQQTYDRMKAERLAEAERLRARGREARVEALEGRPEPGGHREAREDAGGSQQEDGPDPAVQLTGREAVPGRMEGDRQAGGGLVEREEGSRQQHGQRGVHDGRGHARLGARGIRGSAHLERGPFIVCRAWGAGRGGWYARCGVGRNGWGALPPGAPRQRGLRRT